MVPSAEIRTLGPLQIVVDNEVLEIAGRRQRVILAMLALRPNTVVSVEQLIDAVWDTTPPPTARTQVQICVSALRRLFRSSGCPWRLRTRSDGYLLEAAEEQVDHLLFRRQLESARAHEKAGELDRAVRELRAALALWRGPALSGVMSDLVQRNAVRLDDSRMRANVERIRMELELGRHAEVCADLQLLVEEHPLHEELHGYLMLALYRCGRQAEALEAFRRARTILIEKVGVEPSSELRLLERAILNHDKTLDLPFSGVRTAEHAEPGTAETALIPGQLPAVLADFTGRESHLAGIQQWLGGEASARGNSGYQPTRVVVISGRCGVGKSSLAIRAAHALADDYPDGHLYANLRELAPEGSSARVIGRFLRALGVEGSAIPEDPDECAAAFRTRLVGKRLLVVLDDAVSEQQVLPLLPGCATCAVIVTSRTKLSALPGAHRVHVEELDDAQSVELLSRIVGEDRIEAERTGALRLARLCGGLPLALRIAGARLVAKPHWPVRKLVGRLSDEARRLDELTHGYLELRSPLALTYASLDPSAQRLFRLVSLVEMHEFPGWVAAALLDTELDVAEDVLERLVDENVLDVVEYPQERLVRYRMHDLIRIYARERLHATESAEDRDAAARRLLGAWLTRADQAHHAEYGGDYTVVRGDGQRWVAPGGELLALDGSPIAWWEGDRVALTAAVRQAAAIGADEVCWELALRSVTLFESRGCFDDWWETTTVALRVARKAGNTRGSAAMLYSLGTLHLFRQRLDEAERQFAEALALFERCGDSHGMGLVLRNAAHLDWLRGDTTAMLAKYEEALGRLREAGDLMGEAHVLCNLAKYRLSIEDHRGARELLDGAYGISVETGCVRGQAQALYRYAELHLRAGDLDEAEAALDSTLALVREVCDRIGEVHALYGLGMVYTKQQRRDRAEELLRRALSLAKLVGAEQLEEQIGYGLAELAFAGGDLSAVTRYRAAVGTRTPDPDRVRIGKTVAESDAAGADHGTVGQLGTRCRSGG